MRSLLIGPLSSVSEAVPLALAGDHNERYKEVKDDDDL